jgi:hypothetical protein
MSHRLGVVALADYRFHQCQRLQRGLETRFVAGSAADHPVSSLSDGRKVRGSGIPGSLVRKGHEVESRDQTDRPAGILV